MIVREALEAATAALKAAGCGTPKLDAELLIADALDVTRVLAGELDDFTAALEADEKRRKLEAGALVTG